MSGGRPRPGSVLPRQRGATRAGTAGCAATRATFPTDASKCSPAVRRRRVSAFVSWLWTGSSASKVTSVEVAEVPADAADRAHRFLYRLNLDGMLNRDTVSQSLALALLAAAPVSARPPAAASRAGSRRPEHTSAEPPAGAARELRRQRPERRRRPRPHAATPAPGPASAPAKPAALPPGRRPRRRRCRRRSASPGRASSHQAWVAAANPLAVEAGLEILGKGGKALDAAVAVQAMLGLVEPQSSGVGGGALPAVLRRAHRQGERASTGARRAPRRRHARHVPDEHGQPMSFVEAVRSGRSTGVPGAIAMLYTAHAQGRRACAGRSCSHRRSARPAEGFRVSARLAMFLGEGSPFPPTTEIRTLFSRPTGRPRGRRPVPQPRVRQDPAAHRRRGTACAVPGHDRRGDRARRRTRSRCPGR